MSKSDNYGEELQAPTRGVLLGRGMHAMLDATAIHTLAFWLWMFVFVITKSKGPSSQVWSAIVMIGLPYCFAGAMLSLRKSPSPWLLAPIGGTLMILVHLAVVVMVVGLPNWKIIQIWPVLGTSVFSVLGVLIGKIWFHESTPHSRS